jgi:aryl carrier-like protein
VVAQIWHEVLDDASDVDPHVNFFDAGGDSVRLMRLRSLINERLAVDIPILDLFEHTTIARMTELIADRRGA